MNSADAHARLVQLLRRARRTRFAGPAIERTASLIGSRTLTIRSGAGIGLKINPAGTNAGYALGTSEGPVQSALAEVVQADSIVWDIGANVGFFTLIAARRAHKGRVVAFEPLPPNAAAISANADLNSLTNIEVREIALSDFTGTADLQTYDAATWAKLDTSTDTGFKSDQKVRSTVKVPVQTIDVQLDDLDPPNVVKIDIEGAEVAALRGGERLLSAVRPVIICEFHGTNDAVCDVLEAHGYVLDTIEQPGTHPREAPWNAHLLGIPNEDARAS